MTRLPQSCERHQRYSFHIIYRYLQGLDNDLMVIIIVRTASGTMHMIEGCTRCVNQGRLIDVEIAGFIKHWGRKGRIETRSRYSYQWTAELDIVTNELQNLAHTDNRADNIFTTMVTHDRRKLTDWPVYSIWSLQQLSVQSPLHRRILEV